MKRRFGVSSSNAGWGRRTDEQTDGQTLKKSEPQIHLAVRLYTIVWWFYTCTCAFKGAWQMGGWRKPLEILVKRSYTGGGVSLSPPTLSSRRSFSWLLPCQALLVIPPLQLLCLLGQSYRHLFMWKGLNNPTRTLVFVCLAFFCFLIFSDEQLKV